MGPSDPRNRYARITTGVNGVVDGSGQGGNMNEKNFSSTVAPVTEDGTDMRTANRGLKAADLRGG